ncbi:MAG TPA: signal peptidase I [Longimicrobiaceae bacterium]|nr:signal peptidase I [Longimicrobiaceae bacterium]
MKGSTAGRTYGKRTPEGEPPTRKDAKKKEEDGLLEWVKSGAIAIVLFLVIRTFLIQAYTIPSGSMENTLLVGDFLMANNAIYGAQIPFTDVHVPAFRDPRHGDVVVFRPAYNDPVIDVVKRVIGEPGDTIQMIDRVVYRNGERVDEPYVEPTFTPDEPLERYGPTGYEWQLKALPSTVDPSSYHPTRDTWGPLIVPPEEYLLLGDNRDNSLDSRYEGFIPRDVIRGKAMFLYYSIDHSHRHPFPRFLTGARWGRIGKIIH